MLKITHAAVTRQDVWDAFRRCHDVRLRESYHAVLLLLDGHTCPDIATWLYRDEDTIRIWIHAVNEQGLEGLQREPISGRPS
jgi:transposase